MTSRSKANVVRLLKQIIEHRDQRRKYADSLEEPMRTLEKQTADHVLDAKLAEFVDTLPELMKH